MGGKALKNCITRRYQKEEFLIITPIIKNKLLKIFSKCDMPKYYRNKESFGDADFICCIDNHFNLDIKQFIIDEFQSKEIFQNSHVYSFEYNELQVDIILTPKSSYETSLNYHCWNDLNNLIGKIAHKFGLKHGYDGLIMPYRIDGKMLGEVVVSKDYRKSLAFLGFNVERYDAGFDNLNEIFDFVTSSKYFNPWMFDFETLNRINRERDKKRATYAAFVEHVAPMKEKGKEAYPYFYSDKRVYLGLIDHYFPGFLKEYRQLEKLEERKRAVSALYNGNIVMRHFDLSGATLGAAIGEFEKYFSSRKLLEDYVLETDNTLHIMDKFRIVNNLTIIKCSCDKPGYNNDCMVHNYKINEK